MTDPQQHPRYRQIADEIRQRILTGVLPAGAPLPTEPEMETEFRASRGTVRLAIALLRTEGLIVTARRRGSHVRPRWPVRRLGMDRYRHAENRAEDPGATFDREFVRVPASVIVAERLAVPEGRPLLERRTVVRAHGMPQEMSTSYLPWELVEGTPLADPNTEPSPGDPVAQLASVGVRVDEVEEQVASRMPSPDEAETLRIPQAAPVLSVVRTLFASGRPVETAVEVVLPGDRSTLVYRFPI